MCICNIYRFHTLMSHKTAQTYERVLWKRNYNSSNGQLIDDNYTPPSFPYCVVFNEHARFRSFSLLFANAFCILNHISFVFLFLILFFTFEDNEDIDIIINYTAIIEHYNLLSILVIFCILCFYRNLRYILQMIQNAYQTGITLIIFCPLMRTLTNTISTDTIWSMTIICCIFHLVTDDYSYIGRNALENENRVRKENENESKINEIRKENKKYIYGTNNILSLNAAVFMSIFLSSRLKSNSYALGFLFLSYIVFRPLKEYLLNISAGVSGKILHIFTCIVLFLVNYLFIFLLRMNLKQKMKDDICVKFLLYVYISVSFIVLIIGPIGFYRIQSYKVTIGGPWDYDTSGEAKQYLVESSNIKNE